jgi:tryptophan halogenase
VGPSRVVRFKSGRYERSWVKNVVAIGNASGFVEPLEATSLGAIGTESALLVETLIDSDFIPGPAQIKHFNGAMGMAWDNIRRFLSIHYKLNTRLETQFWRACRADVDLAGAEDIVEFYRENGPSHHGRVMLLNQLDQFTIDGWLALLVGMQVPHSSRFEPSAAERAEWRRIAEQNRKLAQSAMDVKSTLDAVRSERWRWAPEFYNAMAPMCPIT